MKFFIVAAICSLAAVPASASKIPRPCGHDLRIRCASYDPGQIWEIWTAPGAILEIEFAEGESVPEGNVAATDGSRLERKPRGNFLYLKTKGCLDPEPLLVTTKLPTGQLRSYRFQIETRGSDCTEPAAQTSAPLSMVSTAGAAPKPPHHGNLKYVAENGLTENGDVMYAVKFTYPEDDQAKREARAKARQAAEEQRSTQNLLKKQVAWPGSVLDPDNGNRNYRYAARGTGGLTLACAAPGFTSACVWDNGHFTAFVFPALQRVPALLRINPDGKEATVIPSVHRGASDGDTIIADGTAQLWRFRDGGTVLEIYDLSYNAIGETPGTGTVSPYVRRTLKDTPEIEEGSFQQRQPAPRPQPPQQPQQPPVILQPNPDQGAPDGR